MIVRGLCFLVGGSLLVVGLFIATWAFLDMFPFPGSSRQFYVESVVVGVVLAYCGLRLFRRAASVSNWNPSPLKHTF